MSELFREIALLLVYVCFSVSFVLVIYVEVLSRKLKNCIDREKVISLSDLSLLYSKGGSPPPEILDDTGVMLFKKRRNMLWIVFVFMGILPTTILSVKYVMEADCCSFQRSCEEIK